MSIIVIENPFKTGSHINPINLSSFPDLPPIFRCPIRFRSVSAARAPRGAGQHHPGGDRARATGGLSAPAPPRGGGTSGRPPCATPYRGDGLGTQGPSGPVEHFWGWGMDWIRYLLHDFDDDVYLSTAILINILCILNYIIYYIYNMYLNGKRLFNDDPTTRQVHAWAGGKHPIKRQKRQSFKK